MFSSVAAGVSTKFTLTVGTDYPSSSNEEYLASPSFLVDSFWFCYCNFFSISLILSCKLANYFALVLARSCKFSFVWVPSDCVNKIA